MFKKFNESWFPPELILILGLAAFLRFSGISNLFPSIDELVSMRRSINMVWGELNPHNFVYPTGYYYFLLALQMIRFVYGIFINHWTEPTDLFKSYLIDPMNLASFFRVASVITALLAIYITYETAKKLVGRRYAWIAPLLLAISPFAIHWSTQIRPESLLLLPSSLVLYFGVKYGETGKLKQLLLSGFLLGIAVSVKYNAVYLCAIIPCAIWAYSWAHKSPRFDFGLQKIAMAAFTSIVGFVVLTPFSVLDWKTFRTLFSYLTRYQEITWAGLGLDASYNLLSNSPWSWWMEVFDGISPGFFWALLFASIVIILRWKSQYIVFLGPIAAMVLFLTWFDRSNSYHIIPILPIAVCILALASFEFGNLAKSHWWIITMVVIVFCLLGVKGNLQILSEQRLPDTRIQARVWIEKNILEGTKIVLDKYYVPHLVHSAEQVNYLIENSGSNIDFSTLEIGLPDTKSYWTEHLPVAVNSMEYGKTENGLIKQPQLLTPEQYANLGFDFIVLSDWTYSRFWSSSDYEDIQEYYEAFLINCDTVYDIHDEGHPGPRITILSLHDGCSQ